ncbi:Magi-1 [Aphelenchoides besseyi]|nr:Magi-1 [Aphelenchoides besseyi]
MSDDAVQLPVECVAELIVDADRASTSSSRSPTVENDVRKSTVAANGKPPIQPKNKPSIKTAMPTESRELTAPQVHRLTVPADADGRSPFSVDGGAENSLLVLVSQVHRPGLDDKIKSGDILISANRLLLSGKTCCEVDLLFRAVCSSGNELEVEFVKAGEMPKEISEIFADRRWSAFHVVIRDNVLLNTPPYTTRPREEKEQEGRDFHFVSVDEFRSLQEAGMFLEWGEYDGHLYGTPKPPNVQLDDEQPSSSMVNDIRGPLPPNWEIAYTDLGEKYFIDHNAGTTTWNDPRDERMNDDFQEHEELPDGWERIEDEVHGVFYVDHINKRTQYDPPESTNRPNGAILRNGYSSTAITTNNHIPPEPPFPPPSQPYNHRPNQPSPSAMMPLIHENGYYSDTNTVKRRNTTPYFTVDPAQLKGELLTTRICKGPTGFGFTLIGNDGGNATPEFIQVKSIINGGPAAENNVLHTGDILVYVDNDCMLGATQDEACRILRSIPQGQFATITVCRGYKLILSPTNKIYSENIYAPATNFQNRATDRLEVTIQKSQKGFGFTITESPQGQRIKNVLYPDQCPNLLEGDLILEVDGRNALLLTHSQLVQMLQELPVGYQTRILVSRQSPRHRSRTPTAGFRFGEKQSRTTPLPALPQRSKTPAPQTRTFRSPYGTTTMPRNYGGAVKTHDIYEDLQRLNIGRLSTPAIGGDSIHRQTPNYIPISALAPRSSAYDSRSQLITVNLIRKSEGFGFRLVGGIEMGTPLQVGALIKNGAAERDGRLREGDQIVEIDGRNVIDCQHGVAVNMIKHAATLGHVKLVVRRLRDNWSNSQNNYTSTFSDYGENLPIRPTPSPTYEVNLEKMENEDFGCTLVTLEQKRFIGRIISDSPAERSHRLRAGDCVVAINGYSTTEMTHPQVIAFIKSCGNQVTFTIDPTIQMPRYATAVNGANGHSRLTPNQHVDVSPGPSQYGTLNGYDTNHRSSPQANGNIVIGTGLQYLNQSEKDFKLITVELNRGAKGFGFSIRGGFEFDKMPLFILRMADDGPAAQDGRLKVGDQLVEINGEKTDGMTHNRAISLIREQQTVRLIVRRPTTPN